MATHSFEWQRKSQSLGCRNDASNYLKKKVSKNQVRRGVAIEKFGNWQDVEWRGQFCCDYRAREIVTEIGEDFREYSTLECCGHKIIGGK